MNLKKIIVSVFVILTFTCSRFMSQDFHLSQYESCPLYLNPSFTGMFDGDFRVFGNYRTQWGSIIPNAYNTVAFGGDIPLKKFNIGALVMDNRAGTGAYNVFNFLVSAAKDFSLDKNKNHHISVGIQTGILQKSISVSKLVFNNQFVNQGNGSFNSSLPSGENIGDQSVILPNLNFGFTYYYGNASSRFNPFLGAAVYNIISPKESIINGGARLPQRYIINAGSKINISEKIQIAPRFLLMQQKNITEISAGMLLHYYLKDADTFVMAGADYRKNDAVVAHIGLKKAGFFYRISYDMNTSYLKNYSGGKGAMEFSVTYIPVKPKEKLPVLNVCPRL